ncbi:hypothetical protein ACWIGW_44270 [Nocardia brasiliensis]|uniref:hypothetical protein n=1 Tax=Streptomyces sp. NPDC056056 TaxID=3345698 RepID=UPI0035E31525
MEKILQLVATAPLASLGTPGFILLGSLASILVLTHAVERLLPMLSDRACERAVRLAKAKKNQLSE